MAACDRCGAERPGGATHCAACGSPLSSAPPARRKVATILFCDMTGSTALGERLDPEALRDLMFRYFHDMRMAIERHGGTVEKYIGDAVMAVFGVPTTHEDDALRAARAAADMQASLAQLNEELEHRFGTRIALRIGVNTGEIVAAEASDQELSGSDTIVTGDAVNVAARLEQAAPPGAILVGERTYRAARRALSVEPVEPLALKGKSERIPAYRLVGVQDDSAGRALALAAGMVGREPELARLGGAFAACKAERRARLVTVVGEAGVGKSRLVAEFVDSLSEEVRVLSGHCPSYGEGITYWPLAEVIEQATPAREETAERARARVAQLLSGAEDAARVSELICTAVGIGECIASSEQISWGARRVLESLAQERPVIVVLDDLHWAQPVFIELVEALGSKSRVAPILVLCLARPALLEHHPDFGRDDVTIQLEPLADDDSARLVEALLGGSGLPLGIRARVAEVAGGNPLYIEELLGNLIDDGLLRREHDGWVAATDLSRIEIPPTLEALLGSRLDRLDRDQRAAIERGSVEGQLFHEQAVRAMSAEDRETVGEALTALCRKQLIRATESSLDVAFRFRHLLIRDAAYRGVAKRRRARLHEQFAGWLERAAATRIAEHEEMIGFHFEQAYRYRAELGAVDETARALASRAVDLLARAGRRALLARGDAPAAVNLIERAVSLLAVGDSRRGDLESVLGEARAELHERPTASITAVPGTGPEARPSNAR